MRSPPPARRPRRRGLSASCAPDRIRRRWPPARTASRRAEGAPSSLPTFPGAQELRGAARSFPEKGQRRKRARAQRDGDHRALRPGEDADRGLRVGEEQQQRWPPGGVGKICEVCGTRRPRAGPAPRMPSFIETPPGGHIVCSPASEALASSTRCRASDAFSRATILFSSGLRCAKFVFIVYTCGPA